MKKIRDDADRSAAAPTAGLIEAVEHRREPRYAVTAAVTVVDPGSGAHIDARTADISTEGCYVDSMNPFPVGSSLQIRLTKGGQSFDTQARVTYCKPGVGMGLEFAAVESRPLQVVKDWLAEARGESRVPVHAVDEIERKRESIGSVPKTEGRYALEELLVMLMRKDILTEDEGRSILGRLLR